MYGKCELVVIMKNLSILIKPFIHNFISGTMQSWLDYCLPTYAYKCHIITYRVRKIYMASHRNAFWKMFRESKRLGNTDIDKLRIQKNAVLFGFFKSFLVYPPISKLRFSL